jgi:hypothetical protein
MPKTHVSTPRRARKQTQPRIPARAGAHSRSRAANGTMIAAAAVAAGAAVTAAFVMRRQMRALAMDAVAEVLSASHSIGLFGRPSLLRRLAPAVGVLAAFSAVAGSALLLIAPKLRATAMYESERANTMSPSSNMKTDPSSDGVSHVAT